jgi:hypothetical protein
MLERAVGLDPTYAPAWAALGLRYSYDSHYSNGGEEMFQRSTSANERALALDPNYSDAASQLITNRVERGDLDRAYKEAKSLVERHPENPFAHFALSYVLRYGGLLDESAQECEKALSLDPGNYQLRSCGLVFDLLRNPDRAMDFFRLDLGSEWVSSNLPLHFRREGNAAEARDSANRLSGNNPYDVLSKACLGQESPAELDKVVRAFLSFALADRDSENRYWSAGLAASCGQKELALRLIKSAIEGHYCAYTALQNDPLIAPVRGTPEYGQLLAAAKQCQDKFIRVSR